MSVCNIILSYPIEECQLTNWGNIVSSSFWKVYLLKRRIVLTTRDRKSGIWYYKSFTWDKILISIMEKSPHCFIIPVNVSWHSVFIAPAVKVYGSSSKGCPWIWDLMTTPSTGFTASNWSSLDLSQLYCMNSHIQPACIRPQIYCYKSTVLKARKTRKPMSHLKAQERSLKIMIINVLRLFTSFK